MIAMVIFLAHNLSQRYRHQIRTNNVHLYTVMFSLGELFS
jgi:hypothetical protein